jgi:hypothetical protein
VCIKFYADLGKGATETLPVIRQVFREECMSHTWVFEWKSPNSPTLKKARQMKSKAKSKLIIIWDVKRIVRFEVFTAVTMKNGVKRIVRKEFSLADQTANSV